MIDLKLKWGQDLYGFNLDDGRVIPFRLLTYAEHKAINSLLANQSIDQILVWAHIWQECVLDSYWHDEYLILPAGLHKTLAELIIFMSGPQSETGLKDLIEASRSNALTLEMQMKSVICRVYPGYTIDKLDEMQFNKIVQLFAMAERAMLDSGLIQKPFELVPKEQVKKKGIVSSKEIEELKKELE